MAAKELSESLVEEVTLAWFEALGYQILSGPDIIPGEPTAERSSFQEVILTHRLHETLSNLNPSIPYDALEEVLRKITHTNPPPSWPTTGPFTACSSTA